MAKEKSIVCDRDEISIKTKKSGGNGYLNLTKDQIQRIQFDKCSVKRLFKSVPTEKIEIQTSKLGQPVVYYRLEEGEYFDLYKQDLIKFAQANRIKLLNNID